MSLSLSSLRLECKETGEHADDVEVGLVSCLSIMLIETLSVTCIIVMLC